MPAIAGPGTEPPLDAEAPQDLADLEEVLEGPEADEEASQEQPGEDAASDKAIHRAIPSWQEVVGIVISANMAARAKNPDRKSAGHSRSGRGRSPRGKRPEKAD